jgi:hypothetical protein
VIEAELKARLRDPEAVRAALTARADGNCACARSKPTGTSGTC